MLIEEIAVAVRMNRCMCTDG